MMRMGRVAKTRATYLRGFRKHVACRFALGTIILLKPKNMYRENASEQSRMERTYGDDSRLPRPRPRPEPPYHARIVSEATSSTHRFTGPCAWHVAERRPRWERRAAGGSLGKQRGPRPWWPLHPRRGAAGGAPEIQQRTSSVAATAAPRRLFACEKCGRQFKTKRAVGVHLKLQRCFSNRGRPKTTA